MHVHRDTGATQQFCQPLLLLFAADIMLLVRRLRSVEGSAAAAADSSRDALVVTHHTRVCKTSGAACSAPGYACYGTVDVT